MANDVLSIGIIDANYASVCVLNQLSADYPNEVFYYLNDFNGANFDEWSHRSLMERIKEDTELLLSYHPKLLIVLASEYIEYARDYFNSLEIPVINVVDMVIDELNKEYDKKNIGFLVKSTIHQTNLYQRNINYLHYYQVDADDLERLVINNKVKTGISFEVVKKVLLDLSRKSVDVIAPTSCNQSLLDTEVKEIMPKANLLNLPKVVSRKITNSLNTNDNIKRSGKGMINIIDDGDFSDKNIKDLLNCKYYIKLKK